MSDVAGKSPSKAASTTISFTDREMAVARIYFNKFKPLEGKTISAEDWASIAAEAGINNGRIARNAKFAFNNFVEKISGEKAKAAGTPKRGSGDKDIDEHDENEATPSKKAKSKASPGKGKGRGKKQDLKSEEMIKDEELSEAEVEADVGADQTS